MTDWTPNRKVILAARWQAGLSAGEIANEFGCTRNAILGQIFRLGLSQGQLTFWTKERATELRQLIADKITTRAAAAHFGVSDWCVRYGARKLGLTFTRMRPPKADCEHGGTVQKIKAHTHREPVVVTPEAKQSAQDPSLVPFSQRKSFMELGQRDCRFPYGDPGDENFFFCGAATENGSYCADHNRICHNW